MAGEAFWEIGGRFSHSGIPVVDGEDGALSTSGEASAG